MSSNTPPQWARDRPLWVLVGATDAVLILILVHVEPSWTLLVLTGAVLAASVLVRRWAPQWSP